VPPRASRDANGITRNGLVSDHGVEPHGTRKLVILMISAFVDMLGMLMILPLLPFYAEKLGAGGAIVGLLVASFSVAQLLSAPYWGRFSDRYGRRPALLVSLVASAIAFVVFAYADSLWLLFVSRIIQGAGGGTVGVIQAYVADATKPEDRARALGWLSAATNAGVSIGPAVGTWLRPLGTEWPGLVAAALCVVNMVFVWRYLAEPRTSADRKADLQPRGSSRKAVAQVVTHPQLPASRLILIYAIAIGAFQGTTAVLALFLGFKFGVTEFTIGYFFTYIGVLSVVTRAIFLGPLVDRFGEARLARIGLALLATGLVAMGIAPNIPTLAIAVGLLPLGTAFTFPCVTALLSRVIDGAQRGLYMGVQQTYGGISRVAFPVVFGLAYDRIGAASPFYISSALVLLSFVLARDIASFAPRKTPH
jgi:multidrug resistance protein